MMALEIVASTLSSWGMRELDSAPAFAICDSTMIVPPRARLRSDSEPPGGRRKREELRALLGSRIGFRAAYNRRQFSALQLAHTGGGDELVDRARCDVNSMP